VILVIGIGTPDHGDDAAGLLVAERVRAVASPRTVTVRELVGDQLGLLDLWAGAREVYVIDAVRSGGPPGAVYRFDGAERLTPHFANKSTHAFSLADVIELARAMDRVPPRLIGYGIEGTRWGLGDLVSAPVMAAVAALTRRLCLELRVGTLPMCLGITGVIAGISDDDGVAIALIDTGTGTPVSACLLTCPDAVTGDTVLIHAGYVLRRVDETRTQEVVP